MTVRRPFRRLGLSPGERPRMAGEGLRRLHGSQLAGLRGGQGLRVRAGGGRPLQGFLEWGQVDAGAIHPAPTEVQAAQAAIMTLVSDRDSGFRDVRPEVLEACGAGTGTTWPRLLVNRKPSRISPGSG